MAFHHGGVVASVGSRRVVRCARRIVSRLSRSATAIVSASTAGCVLSGVQRQPTTRARCAAHPHCRCVRSALDGPATGGAAMPTRAVVALATLLLLPLAAAAEGGRRASTSRRPSRPAARRSTLNGAGLRTRFFFKVYAIGLYLEQPAHRRAGHPGRRPGAPRRAAHAALGVGLRDGRRDRRRVQRQRRRRAAAAAGPARSLQVHVPRGDLRRGDHPHLHSRDRHGGRRGRQGRRHHRGQGLRRRAVQRLDRRRTRWTTRSSRRSWPGK